MLPAQSASPSQLLAVMSLSGAAFAKGAVANVNLAFGAECAVDAMAPTAAGFHDVFGNLWQVRCAALRCACCGAVARRSGMLRCVCCAGLGVQGSCAA